MPNVIHVLLTIHDDASSCRDMPSLAACSQHKQSNLLNTYQVLHLGCQLVLVPAQVDDASVADAIGLLAGKKL